MLFYNIYFHPLVEYHEPYKVALNRAKRMVSYLSYCGGSFDLKIGKNYCNKLLKEAISMKIIWVARKLIDI